MAEQPTTRRFDVSCRLLFVAEIDTSLLEHGDGFLAHALEQEALRLIKEGKRDKHFHLTVISARELPPRIERAESEVADV